MPHTNIEIINGKHYEAVEGYGSTFDCHDCAFLNQDCNEVPCFGEDREDGQHVYFLEIES